jgi:hypothetical protein
VNEEGRNAAHVDELCRFIAVGERLGTLPGQLNSHTHTHTHHRTRTFEH